MAELGRKINYEYDPVLAEHKVFGLLRDALCQECSQGLGIRIKHVCKCKWAKVVKISNSWELLLNLPLEKSTFFQYKIKFISGLS
jgi:hypothetical protein